MTQASLKQEKEDDLFFFSTKQLREATVAMELVLHVAQDRGCWSNLASNEQPDQLRCRNLKPNGTLCN